MGWVVYHVPSGKYYHPFKGLVPLELAHVSTEPRDFNGSTEYVSMLYENNDGQMHFAPAKFNEELYRAMNNGDQGNKSESLVPAWPDDKPRFIHYRAVREATPHELTVNETKELYVDSRSGGTVCFIPGNKAEGRPVVYAVSWCHPNDNYNKQLGRAKSSGWLKSDNQQRGRQMTKFYEIKDFISHVDALMSQWGYIRLLGKGKKGKKKAPAAAPKSEALLMLPSPATAATDTPAPAGGIGPGEADGPNYAAG